MILTFTNENKNKFTKMFEHIKKYYVTKRVDEYQKGQIVYECGQNRELRHAFTVHSIQGETAKNMLYIYAKGMDNQLLYTAVSRCEKIENVRIIID